MLGELHGISPRVSLNADGMAPSECQGATFQGLGDLTNRDFELTFGAQIQVFVTALPALDRSLDLLCTLVILWSCSRGAAIIARSEGEAGQPKAGVAS